MAEKTLEWRLNKKCGVEVFDTILEELCVSRQIRLTGLKQHRSANGLNLLLELTVSQLLKQHIRLGLADCKALEFAAKTDLNGELVYLVIHEGWPVHAVELLSVRDCTPLLTFTCRHIDIQRLSPESN